MQKHKFVFWDLIIEVWGSLSFASGNISRFTAVSGKNAGTQYKDKDTKTQTQIQKHKQNNKNTNSKYKNRKVGGGYFSFASGWRWLLVIGKESAFPENHDEELGEGATNSRRRTWWWGNKFETKKLWDGKKFRTKNLGWKQINGSTAGFLDCKKVELRKVRGAKQLIMTAA